MSVASHHYHAHRFVGSILWIFIIWIILVACKPVRIVWLVPVVAVKLFFRFFWRFLCLDWIQIEWCKRYTLLDRSLGGCFLFCICILSSLKSSVLDNWSLLSFIIVNSSCRDWPLLLRLIWVCFVFLRFISTWFLGRTYWFFSRLCLLHVLLRRFKPFIVICTFFLLLLVCCYAFHIITWCL